MPLARRKSAPMTDRGTMLNIVSWMLLAVVVCTLIARFAMKLSMKTRRRRLGLDDLFIALAAVSHNFRVLRVGHEAYGPSFSVSVKQWQYRLSLFASLANMPVTFRLSRYSCIRRLALFMHMPTTTDNDVGRICCVYAVHCQHGMQSHLRMSRDQKGASWTCSKVRRTWLRCIHCSMDGLWRARYRVRLQPTAPVELHS